MAGAARPMATLVVAAALLLAHGAACARVPGPQLLREPALLDEDCTPQQVHLALGEDQTIMRVSWVTNGANCPSEVTWWRVRDGGSGALAADSVATAVGYSFLLTERDMCDEPAASNAFELRVHRASMAGLTPGARYRYQLPGWDTSRPFRAAAASETAGDGDDEPFTFAAFGDLGDPGHVTAKSPGAAATLSQLEKEAPWLDLAVHVGDISYASGRPGLWDSFMAAIEPIASRVPYHIAIGNHEYGYHGAASPADPSGARHAWQPDFGNYGPDSGGECGAAAARRFDMPADPVGPSSSSSSKSSSGVKADASAPAVPPFWYAFTYGPVRFVAMSTEHDCTPGSPQRAWLEQELAAVDRCATPWVVLLAHRPLYVVYPHKANREVADHLRGALEGLLARTAVDVVLSGHVHSYYRTCPVNDESCLEEGQSSANLGSGSGSGSGSGGGPQPNGRPSPAHGAVHIVVGSGGHELSEVEEGQEDWVAAAQRTHGYARITARRGALDVRFVASDDGEVLDSFAVTPSPAARAAREAACAAAGARSGAAAH